MTKSTDPPKREPHVSMTLTNADGQSFRCELPYDLFGLLAINYDDIQQCDPSSAASFLRAFHSSLEAWAMDKALQNTGLESIAISSSDWRELLIGAIDTGLATQPGFRLRLLQLN